MTRCKDFYEKIERDGNFCNMDKTAYKRTVDYIAFCEENNLTLGTLSERAARPLITEKDPVVKAKAIEKLGNQLNRGKRPTAAQILRTVHNTQEGKDHGGRPLEVVVEDETEKNFGDYVNPIETDPNETSSVETDSVDGNLDDPYPYTGEDVDNTGDIPDIPNAIEPTSDVIPEVDIDPIEIEKDIDPEEESPNNPELTEKVVKEFLSNAGHKDPEPKPKKATSEEDKQAIFDKCVFQAFVWGMTGNEIQRRFEKAIRYVDPDEIDQAQKRLGAGN